MPDFTAMADSVAQSFNIPTDIFRSLISKESSWNPNAKGTSGEGGLTQLMPGTASMMGVGNVYDPLQNLQGGAGYLSKLYKQFGDWTSALSAYNAGPGNVNSVAGQQYAASVLAGAGTPVAPGTTVAGSSTGPNVIVIYGGAAVLILALLGFGVFNVIKG